jgi:hypothetical protein
LNAAKDRLSIGKLCENDVCWRKEDVIDHREQVIGCNHPEEDIAKHPENAVAQLGKVLDELHLPIFGVLFVPF